MFWRLHGELAATASLVAQHRRSLAMRLPLRLWHYGDSDRSSDAIGVWFEYISVFTTRLMGRSKKLVSVLCSHFLKILGGFNTLIR